MQRFSHFVMLATLCLGCSAAITDRAEANDGPVYSRQRAAVRGEFGRTEGFRNAGRQHGYYGGYFPYQPVIAGSWYARPYPHHFDYYRRRYSAPPIQPDCPCAPMERSEPIVADDP